MSDTTKQVGPRGRCRRCAPQELEATPGWGRVTAPPEQSKAYRQLKEAMAGLGQVAPIVVRQAGENYDVVDGHLRLQAAKELGWEQVDVYLLDGQVSDDEAREMAIALVGARAQPDRQELAVALDRLLQATEEEPDETARLARTLPFRQKDLTKVVRRLRGETKPHTTRKASHVDLRFRLPPDAAQVVGEAVDLVVAENDGVTRDRAIELIAADFLSGARQ